MATRRKSTRMLDLGDGKKIKVIDKSVERGDRVRCKVTGMIGVATSKHICLNGCVQFGIQPPVDKDGKQPEAIWKDWQQLDVIEAGVVPAGEPNDCEECHKPTGGPDRRVPAGM